jgi:hypothetical protein
MREVDVLSNAEYLPFDLDVERQRLLLLRLDAQQRADAAFLDRRIVSGASQLAWVPLSAVPRAAPQCAAAFIFHIGHCGSTLLARLLQSWPGVQVLREPQALRTLAAWRPHDRAAVDALLPGLVALWVRDPAGGYATVLKATSSCNALAAPLLAALPCSRALLLDMPLRSYLATVFKSEAALQDVASAWPSRAAELEAHGIDVSALAAGADTATVCAAGWLAEQLRFESLSRQVGVSRVLRVDFERLLADPENTLRTVARHFGFDLEGVQAAMASHAWRRYSKAADHAYDAADRAHDLALAERRFGAAIERGVAWVARQRGASPPG